MKYDKPEKCFLFFLRGSLSLLVTAGLGRMHNMRINWLVWDNCPRCRYFFKSCIRISHVSCWAIADVIHRSRRRLKKVKENHQTWFYVIFIWQIFLLLQCYITALQVKNTPTAAKEPPDKTFPFLLTAFVFYHVTPSGAGCHVSRLAPSGNGLGQESCSPEGRKGGGTTSQLAALTRNERSREVLLTGRVSWCLRRKVPDQVPLGAHCCSAFCEH